MPGWDVLLVEMLHLIISYLHNKESPNSKDFASLQRVCKSWSTVARKTLYQHVELGRRGSEIHDASAFVLSPGKNQPRSRTFDTPYQPLKGKMGLFPSLQKLYVADYVVKSYHPLDEFIDGCSPTLQELCFMTLLAFGASPLTRPNTSIKTIRVRFATLNAEMLGCFSVKFEALEELDIGIYDFSATKEWWHELANIGSILKRYTFEIRYQERDQAITSRSDYLQQCVNVARKSVSSHCRKSVKMMYCYNHIYKYSRRKDDIVMRKSPNSYCLEIDQRTQEEYPLADLIESLQLYAPDAIHLLFSRLDNANNWEVFQHFFDMLDPVKEQSFCVQHWQAYCQKAPVCCNVQSLADLTFKDSTFGQNIIPAGICKGLQKIDRLVFDNCKIIADGSYRLKIFLPTTSIRTLKIIPHYYSGYHHYITRGNYTLKIETDNKIYTIKRQAGIIVKDNCDDITEGTNDNLLIWIKCKALERYLITGDRLCNSFELL
ncbi:hypothetical protein MBANPS3_003126 [Mucor bainieri]